MFGATILTEEKGTENKDGVASGLAHVVIQGADAHLIAGEGQGKEGGYQEGEGR